MSLLSKLSAPEPRLQVRGQTTSATVHLFGQDINGMAGGDVVTIATADGAMKNKYNLAQGTTLQPLQTVQPLDVDAHLRCCTWLEEVIDGDWSLTNSQGQEPLRGPGARRARVACWRTSSACGVAADTRRELPAPPRWQRRETTMLCYRALVKCWRRSAMGRVFSLSARACAAQAAAHSEFNLMEEAWLISLEIHSNNLDACAPIRVAHGRPWRPCCYGSSASCWCRASSGCSS